MSPPMAWIVKKVRESHLQSNLNNETVKRPPKSHETVPLIRDIFFCEAQLNYLFLLLKLLLFRLFSRI
jgi:hypothetical protein